MVNTDEISRNAIVLNATEPKQQGCNTDKCVAVPMSELNKTLILLAIYEAFFEIPKYTDLYQPLLIFGRCQYRNFPNFPEL